MSSLRSKAVLVIVGALVMSLMAGCSRSPAAVDDGTGGTGTTTTDPGTTGGSTGGGLGGNTGGSTGGGVFNPGGSTTPTAPVQISATVTDKKMSGFWFWKKIKTVTVQLQNPSSQNVSGKVTVTFTKKGQQVETQDQPFTLSGGQTTTITVSPTKSSDDVQATATSDSSTGGSTGGGTGGGFPSTGGGSSGGWPSTGGGSSGGWPGSGTSTGH